MGNAADPIRPVDDEVSLRCEPGSAPELFAQLLAEEPRLPAVVQQGRTLTFERWWTQSSLLASELVEQGVRRGDVVVLLLPSGPEFAVGFLAAMRVGAIVSAVNPRLGREEIGHIVARCEPRLIITDQAERVAPFSSCPIRHPAVSEAAAVRTPAFTGWTLPEPGQPAVIVWTSGSTGTPKGAWFDHDGLAFIANHMGPLSRLHDRKLFPIPFAHTAYMTRVYDQLLYRTTLVLTPSTWTAEEMLDVLAREQITLGQGVPTQWEKLVALDRLDSTDLSHLRLVSTGASRVSPDLVTALRQRLGCPVVVRYASTEVPLAFGTRIGDPLEIVTSTVGGPLGGAEVEIRDAESVLGVGTTGRVFLRSPGQMRGYWREPELTAATIAPDGWLATSDLGHLDEAGNLTIVGRADDAYIRGGYNIYPSEVESALTAHPDIARAAVVGAPAPVIGEIGVAFVVLLADHPTPPSAARIKAWCADRIADYKVPDHIEFVDDLPVNATYKLDTIRLKQMAATVAASSPRQKATS